MGVYKKLFRYVPEVKLLGYLAILISAVSAFLMVYGYYYIYLFLNEVIVNDNYENAGVYSVKIVVFLCVSAALYLTSGLVSHKLAFRLETNLRKRGIDGLTDSSFRFFDLNSSGYIRKTIDDNAAKTHMAVAHMLPDNSQAFLVPIFTLVLSFLINIRVGILIVVLSVVCGLIMCMMMGNKDFMKKYQEALDRLSSETVEYIRGMQVVKIFGTRLKSFKALYDAITDYSRYALDYSISCKSPYVIYQLIFLGLIAIISIPLSVFLTEIKNPKFMAVELIMIFFLSGVIMVSFMKIMWASMNIYNANFAIDHLEELYKKMQEDKLSYGDRTDFDNYDIEFENVSFSYGDNKVLEDLSFSLKEKRIYALVGHSGSGKSTIAKLLSGFYKVDDEKAGREEVLKALSLAGCDEIIAKFKDGENTIIGSKGVYLSGGEKQRIAIARAILKNSPIVIMDEASAAIDADNEYELQKAFKNLMKDKTVIMIAHRMTSIRNVDESIVLENGRIVERGDNDSLLSAQGLYSRLLNLYETANDWRVSNEKLL